MSADFEVRQPTPEDAEALARLCTQLGYPCTPDVIPARIARLDTDQGARGFVVTRSTEVLGLVTVHMRHTMNHDAPIAQLSLLVVDERARRSGAGRRLVRAVEDWAREHGAERVVVNTALHRDEAHRFYESLAYRHTGRRYMKDLPTGSSERVMHTHDGA